MSWTLDKGSKIWKCSSYADLQYAEITNLAEYGEPFSPYEPGFDQNFTPDFSNVVVEMPQSEVMTNGYGQLVQAVDFPVVKRFLNDSLKLAFGGYSFNDLLKLGFAKPADRTITGNLYGGLGDAPTTPGSITAADAAFIHGTVCFRLMAFTKFTCGADRRTVEAEIGAGDDNWDFSSSTIPNVLNATVGTIFGPDHYNLDAPIQIRYRGKGKYSFAASRPSQSFADMARNIARSLPSRR